MPNFDKQIKDLNFYVNAYLNAEKGSKPFKKARGVIKRLIKELKENDFALYVLYEEKTDRINFIKRLEKLISS